MKSTEYSIKTFLERTKIIYEEIKDIVTEVNLVKYNRGHAGRVYRCLSVNFMLPEDTDTLKEPTNFCYYWDGEFEIYVGKGWQLKKEIELAEQEIDTLINDLKNEFPKVVIDKSHETYTKEKMIDLISLFQHIRAFEIGKKLSKIFA